jgi:arogenate dehydrogenase (NADP+)
MFGPKSGKDGWGDLPFVYDKVRVSNEGLRAKRCERFLNIFSLEGCRIVEMSCAKHNRYAVESEFITHTVGRMLGRLGLESTLIATKSYEKLLEVAQNTAGDSFDLYYGLFMYNVN